MHPGGLGDIELGSPVIDPDGFSHVDAPMKFIADDLGAMLVGGEPNGVGCGGCEGCGGYSQLGDARGWLFLALSLRTVPLLNYLAALN